LGSYDVQVAQTAEGTKINVGGINVAGALSNTTVDARNFQITVGGTTYTYAGGSSTTPLSTLASYINSLGANVNANVIPVDTTSWNLSIQSTKTGIANKISITNLNGGSATDNGNGTGSTIWSDGKTETFSLTGTTYSSGITSSNTLAFATATNSSSPTVLLSQAGISTPIGKYSISSTSSSSLTLTNDLTGLSQAIQVLDPSLGVTNSLNFSQFGIQVNYSTSNNAGDNAGKIISDLVGKSITVLKPSITGTNLSFNLNSISKNALASINGVTYERDSNKIADIVPGLTINITGTTNTNKTPLKTIITAAQGLDNSGTILQSLSSAYNDVISLYVKLTQNPTTQDAGGSFAFQKSLLSYINDFKQKIAQGVQYGGSTTMSFSEMGLLLQKDGTTKFDAIKLSSASSNGLQSKLASGVKIGYTSSTDNLKASITNVLKFNGTIDLQTTSKKAEISAMKNKQVTLSNRLQILQDKYTTQYSKLNTQLFNLNNASQALTSSLTALTNMNASK
jgi:flagellar hook-associated protein 2